MIAPDSSVSLQNYFQKQGFHFWAISDSTGAVLKSLGQEINWLRLGRMPALLTVDKKGGVVWRHQGRSMSDLPDLEMALKSLVNPGDA